MIVDRLENADVYRGLDTRIAAALDWLRRTDVSSLADGKHVLDGERLFAIVQRYRPKPAAEARWEAHRLYTDVQYLAAGAERMGWAPLSEALPVTQPYDPQKDVVFFDARGELLTVCQGQFTIFFPRDVHAPGLAGEVASGEEVVKVVVKCRVG